MATPVVEERHVVHDSDSSGAAMIAVLLVAAVLIIGFLLFMMRAFPFATGGAGSDINVDLPNVDVPAVTPDVTPDVDVDNTVNTNPVP